MPPDCSAARYDSHWCNNGFPQSGACFTGSGTPTCCQEAVCARLWSHNGGKPDLVRVAEIRRTEHPTVEAEHGR